MINNTILRMLNVSQLQRFHLVALIKEYLNSWYMKADEEEGVQLQRKTSLCRFYVRGLCIQPKESCLFSHGIHDLNYQYWQGEEVQFDYLQDTPFCQRNAVKAPKIYINLFEFQKIQKYTLQQLNDNRPFRVEIRNEMHKQMFEEFIALLQDKFPQANLTEDLLIREYTRVGFNKLMTRVKFRHLTSFLCEAQGSRYFKRTILMPPRTKRQTSHIFRRASKQEILEAYRQEYLRIVGKIEGPLEESMLKKILFQMNIQNLSIPPLTLLLKERKMSFPNFIQILNGSSFQEMVEKIKLQPNSQQILQTAIKYLLNSPKDELVNWNDIYSMLAKQLKINNGNIINQIKPLLVLEGFQFMHFPMLQFLHKQQNEFPFELLKHKVCKCPYQSKYDLSTLPLQTDQQLQRHTSIDINDMQSLLRYAPFILKSKILGIDLEGKLRKGGFVEIIQLNNSSNTFLIDIYCMHINKAVDAIDLAKKILRNVLVDTDIVKIFHDCRHDSLALHQCMQSCILNVFDTSATQTLIHQLDTYSQLSNSNDKLTKAKTLIAECSNVKTPGLNEILLRYEASHGVNKNKDKFHRMWAEGEVELFCRRPLDPDYREYCIKDVLDLPEIYHKMQLALPQPSKHLAEWISANYAYYGYLSTSQCQQPK